MTVIRRSEPPTLSPHRLDTLRLYAQLGSYEAVADFRGVSVQAVAQTLTRIRRQIGVATTREALERLPELERAQ